MNIKLLYLIMIRQTIHEKSFREDVNKMLLYNQWSQSYDKDVKVKGYVGPKELTKLLKDHIIVKDHVLDFGCGTGLLGKEIRKTIKPKKLYGLDISLGMIKLSKKKNIYDKLFCLDLYKNTLFSIDNLTIIVSCGVFLEGHVSFNIIPRIMSLLKKDGKFFFTTRLSFYETHKKVLHEMIKPYKTLFITNLKYLPNVDCLTIGLKKI